MSLGMAPPWHSRVEDWRRSRSSNICGHRRDAIVSNYLDTNPLHYIGMEAIFDEEIFRKDAIFDEYYLGKMQFLMKNYLGMDAIFDEELFRKDAIFDEELFRKDASCDASSN